MRRTIGTLSSVLGAMGLLCGMTTAEPPQSPRLDAATGKLKLPTLPVAGRVGPRVATTAARPAQKELPFFSASMLVTVQEALKARGQGAGDAAASGLGIQPGTVGCGSRNPDGNVRVNQDCGFRFQAEEGIAFNPAHPDNLLAGMNDGRVGFNQCGIGFSLDNGQNWGDQLPPFRARLNFNPPAHTVFGGPPTFHTYDAASDPAVAFDSQGRGFFSCVAFNLADFANMLFVAQSPTLAQGSFFTTIPSLASNFIVSEDNNPMALYDKPFIAADRSAASPNRDNVYATWTIFLFDDRCRSPQNPDGFCGSPIFASMSTDHAQTWSKPKIISGSSPSCVFGNFFDPAAGANDCNFDQGSDPIALPNGDVAVVFFNANTPTLTNQQLAVRCHPAGGSLNCDPPTRVGDVFEEGEPSCDFGGGDIRECIPGPFIRTNDFPRIAVNRDNGNLYATWQDYRNGEFDVQLARSTDGGQTWSSSVTVNPDRGLDHYFAAAAVAVTDEADDDHDDSAGDRVGVSYFRSERVPGENIPPAFFTPGAPGVQQAASDYVLAGGTGAKAPFNFKVVSPVFPPPDGGQTGFNGDYSGLTINKGLQAHPIWSDTRNRNPLTGFHDTDIFTDNVRLPGGTAKLQVGQVGQGSGERRPERD